MSEQLKFFVRVGFRSAMEDYYEVKLPESLEERRAYWGGTDNDKIVAPKYIDSLEQREHMAQHIAISDLIIPPGAYARLLGTRLSDAEYDYDYQIIENVPLDLYTPTAWRNFLSAAYQDPLTQYAMSFHPRVTHVGYTDGDGI